MRARFPFRLVPGLLAVVALALTGCRKDADVAAATGALNFTVSHVAGTQPLVLNGPAYATAAGETFTVSTFEYYLSNFRLTRADGSVYAAPNTYFLVNQAKPGSLSFRIQDIPAGSYTALSCLIGIDAPTTGLTDPNTFVGDLNQANGMYWTWNSGHIFLKLEGSVTSVNPARPLVCHIGGYTDPFNAIVTATPTLPGPLTVSETRTPTVSLQADVLKCFDGVSRVQLSTFSNGMMPGAEALRVARDYGAGMLSVTKVQGD